MTVKRRGPHDLLGNRLYHLAWWHIAGAVFDVLEENRRLDQGRVNGTRASVHKANDDAWTLLSSGREYLRDRAAFFWGRRTLTNRAHFPYSTDGVAALYLFLRRRKKEEVEAWYAEVQEFYGDPSQRTLFDAGAEDGGEDGDEAEEAEEVEAEEVAGESES